MPNAPQADPDYLHEEGISQDPRLAFPVILSTLSCSRLALWTADFPERQVSIERHSLHHARIRGV